MKLDDKKNEIITGLNFEYLRQAMFAASLICLIAFISGSTIYGTEFFNNYLALIQGAAYVGIFLFIQFAPTKRKNTSLPLYIISFALSLFFYFLYTFTSDNNSNLFYIIEIYLLPTFLFYGAAFTLRPIVGLRPLVFFTERHVYEGKIFIWHIVLVSLLTLISVLYQLFFYGERMQKIKQFTEYKYDARYDSLTEIFNRKYGQFLVEQSIKNGDKGIFILIDLNEFKKYNDSYGHITGDEVLKRFASILRSSISDDDIYFRLGGDEFVLYLKSEDKDGKDELSILKEISKKTLKIKISAKAIKLSFSAGCVYNNKKTSTFDQLYDLADKSMYEAKKRGKLTCLISL